MLLIFDCDGVILDSMKVHTQVEAQVLAAAGLEIAPEELARRFAGLPQPEILRILAAERGIPLPDDLEIEIGEQKRIAFAKQDLSMPHFHEALAELSAYDRCVASGTRADLLQLSLETAGLYAAFAPHVYSSDLVKRGKPAPDLFLYAAAAFGVAPEQCLVIEDGVAGLQAARTAGMRSLGFCGGSHCGPGYAARLHEAGAAATFDDMRDFPTMVAQAFAAAA